MTVLNLGNGALAYALLQLCASHGRHHQRTTCCALSMRACCRSAISIVCIPTHLKSPSRFIRIYRPHASIAHRVQFSAKDLGLAPAALDKLIAIAGPRYNPATGTVKMVSRRYVEPMNRHLFSIDTLCARFPTRQLNKAYLHKLVETLVAAANVRAIPYPSSHTDLYFRAQTRNSTNKALKLNY